MRELVFRTTKTFVVFTAVRVIMMSRLQHGVHEASDAVVCRQISTIMLVPLTFVVVLGLMSVERLGWPEFRIAIIVLIVVLGLGKWILANLHG